MLKVGQNDFLYSFVVLLAILGPFSTTFANKFTVVLLLAAAVASLVMHFLWSRKIVFWPVSWIPTLCYFGVMTIALISVIINRNDLLGEYLDSVIIGRIVTLITAALSLLVVNLWVSQATEKQLKRFLWMAFFAALIFMLLAVWQFIGNILGINFFIETRDWMHGVPAALRSIVPKRLTSLSEEPNFLAPIIIEFLLLTLLLFRGKGLLKASLLGLGVFVLLFSFSGGAYVNFAIILFAFGLLSLAFNVTRGIVSTTDILFFISVTLASLFIIYVGDILLEIMYYKFQTEASGGSTRSQFLSSLMTLYINSDWSQLLFGHGLATMSVLDAFGLPQELYLFRISNNFYLDMLWESGVLGVLAIMLMYGYLALYGMVSFRQSFLNQTGLLLTIHFGITALYRSEYLAAHFVWVLTIIFVVYRLGFLASNKQVLETSS